MSYVTLDDLAQDAAPAPIRRLPGGLYTRWQRIFLPKHGLYGFLANADKAFVDIVASGNTDKFRYALADVAKIIAMGAATHATGSEVEAWFQKVEVQDYATGLWNEVASGKPPSVATLDPPPLQVQDRNVPNKWTASVPGEKYEEMRRAPVAVPPAASGPGAVDGIPRGALEPLALLPGGDIRAAGWASVASAPGTPVRVDLKVELATGAVDQINVSLPVRWQRADGKRGFDGPVPTMQSGTHVVYAYAVNEATGESAPLTGSPRSIMVAKAPITAPQVSVQVAPRTVVYAPPQEGQPPDSPFAPPPSSAPQDAFLPSPLLPDRRPAKPVGPQDYEVLGLRIPARILGVPTGAFVIAAVGLGIVAFSGGEDAPKKHKDEKP